MFSNYESSGPALLTDPNDHIVGRFVLENTSTTVANTLRRCILTETRSVSFRADLTNATDPGVVIRKNTSVIFNEMLAHRLTLIPLGVRRIDAFDPSRYECILRVKNDTKGPISNSTLRHVKAGDFIVREKQADGSFAEVGAAANAALFPADSITKDTPLIVTLRPQWNPEQPPEEVDLTAYPVIGTGREFIGFSPVSQCSYENTPDTDPVRRDQFFNEWLAAFKKIADPSSVDPTVLANHRREWETMAIQRCFKVDPATGEANSFNFTVESVGIRPVPDIVAEGIRAVIQLVTPYTDSETPSEEVGIRVQPVDSRMNAGIDVMFDDQEHTLGNLLQTMITEIYLDKEMPDSPITYCAYKVKHPLQRIMTLRLAIREGAVGDPAAIARKIIADAASRARTVFEGLAQGWEALVGVGASSSNVAVTVEKEETAPGLDG